MGTETKDVEEFAEENAIGCVSDFRDMEEEEVFISLASCLHHPTILINYGGNIVYKNRRVSNLYSKWRVGSNLKNYVDYTIFKSAMQLKNGDYFCSTYDGEHVAFLRFGKYYFMMYLLGFEVNSNHVFALFHYISCIPEKNFFVNRKLVSKENMSVEQIEKCDKFRKRFEKFYDGFKTFTMDTKEFYTNSIPDKEHDIVDVLLQLVNRINGKHYDFSCRFDLAERDDYYVDCTSKDLGALFGVIFFLALQCSSSKKPVINIGFEKKDNPYFCCVKISVKSDMTKEDVERYFESFELVDERSLYFQTASNMASKYFWGLGADINDGFMVFSLKIVTKPSDDIWFHDVCSYDAACASFFFQDLIRMLLDMPTEYDLYS